jgi:hypothetical protein
VLGLAIAADDRGFAEHRDPIAVDVLDGALGQVSTEYFAILDELAQILVVPTHQRIPNHGDHGDPPKRLRQSLTAFDERIFNQRYCFSNVHGQQEFLEV